VHPPVIRQVRARTEELRQQQDVPLVVVDAALLLETGLHEGLCDALLFVDAPEPTRRARAAGRQISAEQFDRRTRAQLPPENKKETADFIVRNHGSLRDLREQIEELWPRLCAVCNRAERGDPRATLDRE
jgi:dephospho-CoA kinase